MTSLKNKIDYKNKERIFNTVKEISTEGIIVTDKDVNIMSVNPAFSAITGYSTEDVIGENPRIFASGVHNSDFYATMWSSIHEHGMWEGEIWNKTKSGDIFPERLKIRRVVNEVGETENYIGIFTDISKIKETESHINYISNFDLLTNLPNRYLFEKKLKEHINQNNHNKLIGLLHINFDRFKIINESFGHAVGDFFLQELGSRLESILGEEDILARFTGDEFTILLSTVYKAEEVENRAKKIFQLLNTPLKYKEVEVYVTASIGACVYPNHGNDDETLIKNADIAMAKAKEHDGNTFQFFKASLEKEMSREFTIETYLRNSLIFDEFSIHYQPQIDIHSNKIIGVEALLRWKHPILGHVSPMEFIPIAERTGLIIKIGHWVIEEVCKQIVDWKNRGLPPIKVAINCSPKQFFHPALIENLSKIIERLEISPELIELEITESVSMHDGNRILNTLRKLKRIGIQVSIDDFGRGHSSLSYIKSFPLNTIKIDKLFVQDINDEGNRVIIKTIIEMSHGLGLKVIAEGVESLMELQYLKKQGCDIAQGYLYSKPLTVNQLTVLFNDCKYNGSYYIS
ncbi:EAL domain-containing protein [Evansella sp. AB-P1]|uniref:putative bifunctional diguanylate cyclase/phosphodiesterase n=1 Tax=Evansella sp. AB-P1 TaxID=3037653 RepID=UPI00241D274E|nr:EAL domain-containing protein [Evansella sp. AB-P1]MDG5789534.1 EAL domain-containing protein [Evansella sp. AB-P1]